MDNAPLERDQRDVGCENSAEFPESQELFTGSEYDTEAARETDNTGTSSSSQDDDSLFLDHVTCTPTRTRRKRRGGAGADFPSASQFELSDSSDFELPSAKLSLNDFFGTQKERRKVDKRRWRKRRADVRRKSARSRVTSKQERRLRWLHRGVRFPFTPYKYLPFRLYFAYEQYVFGGFLNYMQKLKFKRHLQNSLKDIAARDDPQDEDVETQEYSYLDDDGPISPISESAENVNCDEDVTEECDVKIVDNDTFILDSKVPNNWRLKKKKKKNIILGKKSFDVDSTVPKKVHRKKKKKVNKQQLERKRRNHIKDSFQSLRDSVPSLQGTKASRAQILDKATEYIQYLTRKHRAHQQDIDDLQRQNAVLEQKVRALKKARSDSRPQSNYSSSGSSLYTNPNGSTISAFHGGSDPSSESESEEPKESDTKAITPTASTFYLQPFHIS